MNLKQAAHVLAKDLRLGPRSPVFLWVLALPLVFTFLISAVFGDLFAPPARLAVVDESSSRITAALQAVDGIEVTVLDDADAMSAAVEAHDYDAGLLLPAGTDEALATGQQTELVLVVSGQSLASTRLVIDVTTLDELRAASGGSPPVEVVVATVGDQKWVPVEDRLLPFIVMYAVIIAGLFLPASSMVEEREKRTLDALLITPVRMSEILVGKGALGVLLAVMMGWVTLALNDAFGSQPLAMTLFLLLGGVMMAELGLVVGSWAKDSNTLFTTVKGGALLVVAPVLFTLFPGLPQWIAQLFPTYYFLQPIYDMAVTGTTFSEHLVELAACVAICLALLPAVSAMGRRLEQQMAATV
ncbi:MAG: ABC transporter permease [Jiangellales bacterium]